MQLIRRLLIGVCARGHPVFKSESCRCGPTSPAHRSKTLCGIIVRLLCILVWLAPSSKSAYRRRCSVCKENHSVDIEGCPFAGCAGADWGKSTAGSSPDVGRWRRRLGICCNVVWQTAPLWPAFFFGPYNARKHTILFLPHTRRIPGANCFRCGCIGYTWISTPSVELYLGSCVLCCANGTGNQGSLV